MRILITGCKGQLGSELMALAAVIPKVEAIGVDIDSLDLTDSSEVEAFLRRERFTHVVNCAAYTAVDRAEEQAALLRTLPRARNVVEYPFYFRRAEIRVGDKPRLFVN